MKTVDPLSVDIYIFLYHFIEVSYYNYTALKFEVHQAASYPRKFEFHVLDKQVFFAEGSLYLAPGPAVQTGQQ